KKIVVEMGGTLEYDKVCSAIRLLGSRFFADLQGQRSNAKSKTYDANALDEVSQDEPERAFQATSPVLPEEADQELDSEFIEAMVAHDDQDALQVQSFEEELEGFFQETPELQEALVSYLEARTRLLQKKKSRGFWPVGSTGKGSKGGRGFKGKGKGKPGRDQLLARIARSTCRACGERGHWKAECPKYGRPGSMSQKGEATTTVAEVEETFATTTITTDDTASEVHTSVPEEAISLDEAHFAESGTPLLWSKKAIKQLGGVIDTNEDVCHLTRLQKSLHLRTGPTGLYLVDLARLCEESGQEQQCQTVGNSETTSFRKYPETDNDSPQVEVPTPATSSCARLSDPTLKYSLADIANMSLPELGKLTINFGRAMKGRTYESVVENEPDWTKWMCEHMSSSPKHCHQAFLLYVEKYTVHAEQLEAALCQDFEGTEPEAAPPTARPKPRASPKKVRAPGADRVSPDQWDMVSAIEGEEPPLDSQVSSLASRMTQMEHVMQQVLGAIQQISGAQQSA
ncbi:unnamed protein product, partial [Symbiodinium necroappetens]